MKIDEIIGRPMRHWMEDGSVELMLGIQFFLTGVVFWFGQTLAHDSGLKKVYAMLAPVIWGCVILVCQRAIKQLKENVVAPRAGYVALQQGIRVRVPSEREKLAIAGIVIAALGALIATLYLMVANPEVIDRWTESRWVIGVVSSLVFALIWTWSAIHLLTLLSGCLAGWMYARRGSVVIDLMILVVSIGFGQAVMGAWRLREFLQANPRIEGE